MSKILPTIAVIEQTHAWGDCSKHDSETAGRHCHCSLQVAAIRTGERRTCRHCGIVEDAQTMEQAHEEALTENAAHDAAMEKAQELTPQLLDQLTRPQLPRAMRYGAGRLMLVPPAGA